CSLRPLSPSLPSSFTSPRPPPPRSTLFPYTTLFRSCSEFFEQLAYCTISMGAVVSTDLCQRSDCAAYFIRINHGEAPVFLLGFSTLRLQETEGTCMARFEDGD